MKIIYQDEYGETVYAPYEEQPTSHIPMIGDTVMIDDEDWRVAGRVFHPQQDTVVVQITQNLVRTQQQPNNDSNRLNEATRAIIDLSNRQSIAEKKTRALTDQVSSVRKHINQRIQQEKKE